MPVLRPEIRGAALVLVAALLWSTGGACVKVLDGYPPLAISAGRSVISALLFLALLRGHIGLPSTMKRWIGLGAAVYALVVITFVVATRFTTAANAILLQYTAPLWIAVLGWTVLGERPSSRDLVALALGGGGVILCASEGLALFMENRSISKTLLGDALALGSGLCFAGMTIILRITSRREGEGRDPRDIRDGRDTRNREASRQGSAAGDPIGAGPAGDRGRDEPSASLLCLFYGNLLAAVIGMPALVSALPNAGIEGHSAWLGLAVLVWLGAGQLGGGYWFFQRGLRTTRALTASLLGLIEPVLNPVWAALVVAEIPSRGTLVGGLLVLVSVALSLTAGRRR